MKDIVTQIKEMLDKHNGTDWECTHINRVFAEVLLDQIQKQRELLEQSLFTLEYLNDQWLYDKDKELNKFIREIKQFLEK